MFIDLSKHRIPLLRKTPEILRHLTNKHEYIIILDGAHFNRGYFNQTRKIDNFQLKKHIPENWLFKCYES